VAYNNLVIKPPAQHNLRRNLTEEIMNRVQCIALAFAVWLANNAAAIAQVQPANEASWSRAINLLPLINPATDTVRGKWSVRAGALVAEPEQFSRIQIPFEPPEEYDFRIIFNRISGEDEVSQYFSQTGRMAMWQMGAIKNSLFGFQMVGGRGTGGGNSTTIKTENCLKTGKLSTSVLAIRKNGVKAYLDGKLISEWATDFSDASLDSRYWPMPDNRLLGLAAHKNYTAFYRIELLEITGKGKPSRGGMAAAVATAPAQRAAAVVPAQPQQPAAVSQPAAAPGGALVCPIQLVQVRQSTKKKDVTSGPANRATYQHSQALTIMIRNTTRLPVSGVTVRWGILRTELQGGRETAYGKDEVLDFIPLEMKTIETASVEARGRRWNYRAQEGQKITGHGVQVRMGGQVVGEEYSQATAKAALEALKPLESGQ